MNPYSGKKQSKMFISDVIEIFCKNCYKPTVMMTLERGNGIELVHKYGSDYSKIVCIGGDGTLNEVINGMLIGKHKTPIAYIPAGSTNDFATSLDIPKNMIKATEKIVCGKPILLDVGKFGDRYFSYVASFGAFTRTSCSTPQNLKNVLGRMAYFFEGIKDLSLIKRIHLRIETDNEIHEDDYIFGAISNSTSIAGILSFDPETVNMSDGQFELLLVKYPNNILELNDIIHSILSNKFDNDKITFSKAKNATFYCNEIIDWTVDGEQVDAQCINYATNVHNAISIIL